MAPTFGASGDGGRVTRRAKPFGKKDHPSSAHKDVPNKPGKTNWVENAGGLPSYIARIAKHLIADQGMTTSRAIATAVSQCRKWAAQGKPEATKAIAEWEAKKRKGKKS